MKWKQLFSFFRSKNDFDKKIKSIVGYYPHDAFFYELAFTHKSRVNSRISDNKESNERLEYLGDAMLSAAVSDYLYKNYKEMDEGELSKLRSKIVSRKSLNGLGANMKLQHLLVANVNATAMKNSVLGNTLEALIGACYLDHGFIRCKKFILDGIIRKHLNMDEVIRMEVNYKSRILEWGQKNKKTISFETTAEIGVGTKKKFSIALLVDGEIKTEGTDSSKKGAEQKASKIFSTHINE
ncbi:MAG: ribonuclease-3 [Saprospiraceae bacterium]